MLHSVLSKLPRPLDLDDLITRTVELLRKYPPEKLLGRAWRQISPNSVLKTANEPASLRNQSLADGERFFHAQAAELKRREALIQTKKRIQTLACQYRRPATLTGTALLFAFIAFYARTNSAQPTFVAIGSFLSGMQRTILDYWRLILT
jgi:TBC1 domain family member 20